MDEWIEVFAEKRYLKGIQMVERRSFLKRLSNVLSDLSKSEELTHIASITVGDTVRDSASLVSDWDSYNLSITLAPRPLPKNSVGVMRTASFEIMRNRLMSDDVYVTLKWDEMESEESEIAKIMDFVSSVDVALDSSSQGESTFNPTAPKSSGSGAAVEKFRRLRASKVSDMKALFDRMEILNERLLDLWNRNLLVELEKPPELSVHLRVNENQHQVNIWDIPKPSVLSVKGGKKVKYSIPQGTHFGKVFVCEDVEEGWRNLAEYLSDHLSFINEDIPGEALAIYEAVRLDKEGARRSSQRERKKI